MRDVVNRFRQSEDGNFAIISAVFFSVIALAVAGAIDYSRGHSTQQSLQDALDIATLQAAKMASETSYSDSGEMLFDKNFIASAGLKVNEVTFNLVEDQMIGEARAELSTLLGGFINSSHLNVGARSVVQLSQGEPAIPCFMSLDNSNSSRNTFTLNSGAMIDTPNCEIHTHGLSNGTLSLRPRTQLTAERICNASKYSSNHNSNRRELTRVEGECDVDPDPYAGKFPVPTVSGDCISNRNFNNGDVTMVPGVYCGDQIFNTNGTITFLPGTYVLNNANFFTTSSGQSWVGDGVTFYFMNTNSSIISNVSVNMDMKAPTSGPYAGMFLMENENATVGWTPEFRITDNSDFNFEGGFYLPNRRITFNSGTSITSSGASIVARAFTFNEVNISITGGAPTSGGVVSGGEIYMTE